LRSVPGGPRGKLREYAPLYTVEQARASLRLLHARRYGESFEPHAGVRVLFRDSGHILGAASMKMTFGSGAGSRVLVVSGDIGSPGRPLVNDPDPVPHADWLVIESTYGNRAHRDLAATLDELVGIVTHMH
jgi:metallo-beta-lactamase family protein